MTQKTKHNYIVGGIAGFILGWFLFEKDPVTGILLALFSVILGLAVAQRIEDNA